MARRITASAGCILVQLLCLTAAVPAGAPPPDAVNLQTSVIGLPNQLRNHWQRRRDAISTMHCVLRWKRTIARGRYNLEIPGLPAEIVGALPREPECIENTYRIWIDFDNPRCRVEYEGMLFCSERDVLQHVPRMAIYLFDGHRIQEYLPRFKNPFLARSPYVELKEYPPGSEIHESFFEPIAFPVFHGIGLIDGPGCGFRLGAGQSMSTGGRFTVKNLTGARLDGPIAFVSTEHAITDPIVTEIEVLPGQDFGMTRKAVFVGNRLIHEFRIDLAMSDFGWMPKRWTFSYYSPAGDLLETSQCEVLERRFNDDLQAIAFRVSPQFVVDDRDRNLSPAVALVTPLPHKDVSLSDGQRNDTRLGTLVGILLGTLLLVRWRMRTANQRVMQRSRANSTVRVKTNAWTYRKHRHCFQTPLDAPTRRTRR